MFKLFGDSLVTLPKSINNLESINELLSSYGNIHHDKLFNKCITWYIENSSKFSYNDIINILVNIYNRFNLKNVSISCKDKFIEVMTTRLIACIPKLERIQDFTTLLALHNTLNMKSMEAMKIIEEGLARLTMSNCMIDFSSLR